MKNSFYDPYSKHGFIDIPLREGERIMRLAPFNGKLYVFTNERMFVAKPKAKIRVWIDRLIGRLKR